MKGNFYDFKKLATIREAKFTQEKFAELLDSTVVTVSRLENGHSASYELIMKACQLLDIDSNKVLYSSKQLSFAS